ncbi:cytochrome-c peroxidase [Vibrio maerlii]|uniref:cytochrome-c peroxidase n=1 Tax=Vibrio maerlii TaxID=2231648 RepID=UPI000E3EB9D8|nr:cytochrome c peroxidase [Vibrio maerlii]
MENKKWIFSGSVIVLGSVGLLLSHAFHPANNDSDHHQDVSQADSHTSEHADVGHDHSHHPESYNPVTANQSVIIPIPTSIDHIDKEKAKLGWKLFKDPNLSSNGRVSCETCHNLNTNGAELTEVSVGVGGQGTRNSLTVFNVAYNYRFFWDGRVNRLSEQIDGPIHDPQEMDSNWNNIETYVKQSKRYSDDFEKLGLKISEQSIKSALVEFMEALNTPNSDFDQYLLGNREALNSSAKRGWQKFQDEGCVTCHRGQNIGGGMVMRFGFFGEDKMGNKRSEDTGRFLTTSKAEDMFLFRVASLRNVAKTAPYFHDGRTQSLEEAVTIMGESQLGKTLEPQTIDDIVAFLNSLSGENPSILKEFANEQE